MCAQKARLRMVRGVEVFRTESLRSHLKASAASRTGSPSLRDKDTSEVWVIFEEQLSKNRW